MSYRVKIQVFDGPFDLLLHLIKINEMDINDIRVAEITNQYLEYIQLLKDLDLEVAGEFLVMAATLIKIKARSLLPPREDESDEEEIDEILSAKQLMKQLIQYRKFKELAHSLREREQQYSDVFFRSPGITSTVPGAERKPEDVLREDIRNLFTAFSRVLKYAEAKGFHEISEEEFSVEDKIHYIKNLLLEKHSLNIVEIFKACINKSELIAVFLATLELCRLQQITLKQAGLFEPIYISLKEPNTEKNT